MAYLYKKKAPAKVPKTYDIMAKSLKEKATIPERLRMR